MSEPGEENRHEHSHVQPVPGPVIAGHHIQRYEAHHAWVIDHILLPCSVSEYRCLGLLLEQANTCLPYAAFFQPEIMASTGNSKRDRGRLAATISHLRSRLWVCGFEIANVWNIGYLLLSDPPDEYLSGSRSHQYEENNRSS